MKTLPTTIANLFLCRRTIALLALTAFALLEMAPSAGGSRIKRDIDISSPVQVIDPEKFTDSGFADDYNLIDRLPDSNDEQTEDGGQRSFVHLRGLGSPRMLVLLNGRRLAPVAQTGKVDLSAIPAASIERIELLNDGASAIYGGDAVAGVVNIITRENPLADQWEGYDTFIPRPAIPALGIYDSFIRNFTGSVDFPLHCDYGSAGVLPGTFLSPWLDGYNIERYGDNFYIPFVQPDVAAGDAAPDATPDATAPEDAGPADTDESGNAGEQPAGPRGAPGGNGPGGKRSQPPAKPTPLQQWDRGVPPWSLVLRSPEVAHLLEQLRPYYELRMEKRDAMAALGYWGLSKSELAENKDAYDAARDIWKGTRREIITLLGPYIDPAIAATVTTGDPIWEGNAGPILPEDIFGADTKVLHPSQQAAQAAQDATLQAEADRRPPLEADDTGGGRASNTFRMSVGIKGLYGDLGYSDYWLQGEYLPDADTDAVLTQTLRPRAEFGDGFGSSRLDVQPYLGQLQYKEDGSTSIAPAEGGLFSPNYPYETWSPLPSPGGLQDGELHSDLGSTLGFGGRGGRVQYGDTRFDLDSYVTPRLGYSYGRDGSTRSGDPIYSRYYGKYTDHQGNAPAEVMNAWRDMERYRRYGDYDARMALRQSLGNDFFNYQQGRYDYDALENAFGLPAEGSDTQLDFDVSRYRIGYNWNERWAALTIPVNRYEGVTVRSRKPRWSGMSGTPGDPVPEAWQRFVSSRWNIGENYYTTFRWAEGTHPNIDFSRIFGDDATEENDYCATEAFPVNASISSVINGRRIPDEWFMERIGMGEPADGAPVIVAIIDSGLDYHHLDINWDNLWFNGGEIPDNQLDDDDNGFVDDIIGWDFTVNANSPWDHDGHGTFVAGLIAAEHGNHSGIAGINPNARIMVLKALNNFGHTRVSWLAQAIVYAVDNGARIINLSAAGPGLPTFVQDAVNYADSKGVLVFVAAGNSAENVDGISPAGLDKVITVAATGLDDARAPFSNWGKRIDIAAPGMHIKSLRARQTDFRLTSLDGLYKRGSAILDGDRRAYRADGTSFAAPLVAGVASLLWSQNPKLTHTQVRRMLEQSARDIDTPGRDQFTGYGLLNADAALNADPDFYSLAAIDSVAIALVTGRQVARVTGTADADNFAGAVLEIGEGESPVSWKRIGKKLKEPVRSGLLGDIPPKSLQGAPVWTVRIITEHKNGFLREARYRLNIGG